MQTFIPLFLIIPLVGFIVSLWIPERFEKWISNTAFFTVLVQFFSLLFFVLFWLMKDAIPMETKVFSVFESVHYHFYVDFYFDVLSAVFLLIGVILTLVVTTFSRFYLHREKGYKRFFNTLLFFFLGYNIVILAGNFETLFIGWEIIGLSSFLLIAFYRERYNPVKNAFKVFSIYRIGDIAFILAMWGSHHLFHENITFGQLQEVDFIIKTTMHHAHLSLFISCCLVFAAVVKSAQIPFSSWLPRAMEGPTPSSAIFYGSLSVHLGVFLLLRTFPFWEQQEIVRWFIGIIGFMSSILAFIIVRVQSTVKSQIAYSSIAQIGIIFIEIALGFESLALLHFVLNAFLRTYQLLVSPSRVSFLIKQQLFQPKSESVFQNSWYSKKIIYSLYLLALKEFYFEKVLHILIWSPLKIIGKTFDFLTMKQVFWFTIPGFFSLLLLFHFRLHLPSDFLEYFPEIISFIALTMIFKAFSERKNPFMAWFFIVFHHFWIVMAISFNDKLSYHEIMFYLLGVIVSAILGFFTLVHLKKVEKRILINQYLGHVYEHPKLALLFLISTLGLIGFPITSTFVGEDLIFSHIEKNQVFLAFFVASSFIVSGLAGIRLYARLFLGPHIKTYHAIANKSS